MTINWRRGFFRVWAICALTWVIGVGVYAVALWRDHTYRYYYSASRDSLHSSSYNLVEAPYFQRDETLTIQADRATIVFVTDLPERKQILIHAPDAPKQVKFALPTPANVAPLLDRAEQQRREKQLSELTTSLLVMVMPPVVVLALGALLAWALRGFRSTS